MKIAITVWCVFGLLLSLFVDVQTDAKLRVTIECAAMLLALAVLWR